MCVCTLNFLFTKVIFGGKKKKKLKNLCYRALQLQNKNKNICKTVPPPYPPPLPKFPPPPPRPPKMGFMKDVFSQNKTSQSYATQLK